MALITRSRHGEHVAPEIVVDVVFALFVSSVSLTVAPESAVIVLESGEVVLAVVCTFIVTVVSAPDGRSPVQSTGPDGGDACAQVKPFVAEAPRKLTPAGTVC